MVNVKEHFQDIITISFPKPADDLFTLVVEEIETTLRYTVISISHYVGLFVGSFLE